MMPVLHWAAIPLRQAVDEIGCFDRNSEDVESPR